MKSKPDNNKGDQEYTYSDHSAMTLKVHASRTADKQAGWYLPYLQPGMTLLDCGCGSGSITLGLAKAVDPGQVTGVDMLEAEIERACERAAENQITNTRFEVGDICQLDFPSNSFDALFSHNVLEHIPEPGKVLQEMRRVLTPGGIIGIRDMDLGGYVIAPDDAAIEKAAFIWGAVVENRGGNLRIGRHLGELLYKGGFKNVKMTASYDEVHGYLEGLNGYAQNIAARFAEPDFIKQVTGSGLATLEELEIMKEALLKWPERPGAFHAGAHCEAIGRKA